MDHSLGLEQQQAREDLILRMFLGPGAEYVGPRLSPEDEDWPTAAMMDERQQRQDHGHEDASQSAQQHHPGHRGHSPTEFHGAGPQMARNSGRLIMPAHGTTTTAASVAWGIR